VPQSLLEVAEQVAWFKSQRGRGGNKKSAASSVSAGGGGHKGPRFRERPGLGSGSAGGSSTISRGASAYESGSELRQTDRVASLKQAFASSFKSQFVSASEQTHLKPSTAAVPRGCVVKKSREAGEEEAAGGKKSRWDK